MTTTRDRIAEIGREMIAHASRPDVSAAIMRRREAHRVEHACSCHAEAARVARDAPGRTDARPASLAGSTEARNGRASACARAQTAREGWGT